MEPQMARPTYFHTMSLGLPIFLPIAIFTLISCLISLQFQSLEALCWIVVAICIGVSVMFMVVRQSREGPKYWFNLGALCFLATVFGFALGMWNYHGYMVSYRAYGGQREYTDVEPSAPALQYLDAGQIVFRQDARLDLNRVIAYEAVGRPTVCLAPVVAGDARPSTIDFWAAGTNCCLVGSEPFVGRNFTCGDALNSEARAGLVMFDDLHSHLPEYRTAARDGRGTHGLTSAQDAIFLEWTAKPAEALNHYYFRGVHCLVAGIVIYFVLSMVGGFMLHFIRRMPSRPMKEKLTARAYMDTNRYGTYT
jgi:hypothetical protein